MELTYEQIAEFELRLADKAIAEMRADCKRLREENERLRAAMTKLVDALHDTSPEAPSLAGVAEDEAIALLAGYGDDPGTCYR